MKKIITLCVFFLLSLSQYGQSGSDSLYFKPLYQPEVKYIFKTVAGTTHTGYVIKETPKSVTLENRSINEKLELNKADIVSARPLEIKKPIKEEAFEENSHADTYLLSGSAFEFDDGGVVSNNHWLLLQNIDYSINKNFAFTTNAIAFVPFSLGIKCAFKLNTYNSVGGAIFGVGRLFGSNNGNPAFWASAMLLKYTHGTSNKNFTFSGGILGIRAQLISNSTTKAFINVPFVSAAYCNRFSQNVAVVAEAWYLPSTMSLIGGLGFKLIGDERYNWTFGCYSFIDNADNSFKLNLKTVPIPYIGIGRKFN
ncbi:MAG: hypothetical protein IT236_14535 [Bacteroidia bacterium]|nr:hypothetical protein [Bacteroidia bacterium]